MDPTGEVLLQMESLDMAGRNPSGSTPTGTSGRVWKKTPEGMLVVIPICRLHCRPTPWLEPEESIPTGK